MRGAWRRTRVAVLATVVVVTSCSSPGPDDANDASTSSTVAPSSTGSAPPSTTNLPLSTGTVTVGDDVYELAVTCYAPGAGEVLAIGVGTDAATGDLVEAYVQAYVGSPYVGLRVGDGPLLESTFDGPLELFLQDNVIRASAIRFVRDLDLDTGEGTAAGFGEIEIMCDRYEDEIPT